MAELNFPANPAIGNEYIAAGYAYRWDGVKWMTVQSGEKSFAAALAEHKSGTNQHTISGIAGLTEALGTKASNGYGLGYAGIIPVTDRSGFFATSSNNTPGYPGNGGGWQSAYNTNRRAQIYINAFGAMFSRFSMSDDVVDVTTPWNTVYTSLNKPTAADLGVATLGYLSSEDLNAVTTAGIYIQTQSSAATTARNYPSPEAGMLVVMYSNSIRVQEYTTYGNHYKYVRGWSGTAWTQWTNIPNARQNDTKYVKIAGDTMAGDLATFTIRPVTNNAYDVGSSTFRYRTIYAVTGAINTSDARVKTAISAFSDNELNAAIEISKEIGMYQFLDAIAAKGSDKARHHVGMTVQRAIEIMESHNLDPFAYGFICYDKWDADAEQNIEAGDCYAFRYDQLNLFVAKGISARLDKLENSL